jgi:hypothetical protein
MKSLTPREEGGMREIVIAAKRRKKHKKDDKKEVSLIYVRICWGNRMNFTARSQRPQRGVYV